MTFRSGILFPLCAASFAAIACVPNRSPSPHADLSAAAEPLRTAFNTDTGRVRIVMLVSPTCGACLHGAGSLEDHLLARNADPRLRAYVVWVPKLGAHESDVPVATRFVADGRATHYWDSAGVLVQAYDQVLGLHQDAWDVYLLYGRGTRWDGPLPPVPNFWMHQLGSPLHAQGVPAPFLDPDVFAERATATLIGADPAADGPR